MAHELSHVLLRHGTANATKAQNPWLQLGQIAGAIGGAVVGGAAGSAIAQGSAVRPRHAAAAIQPRLREAGRSARRADHGARRLRSARARAHVRDDRARGASERRQRSAVDEQPSRSRQPHAVYITKEAEALTIASRAGHERQFEPIKTAFASLPAAKSMAIWRARRATSGGEPTSLSRHAGPARAAAVDAVPQRQRRQAYFRRRFRRTGPALPSNNSIKVVPENGYGQLERPDRLQPRHRVRRHARRHRAICAKRPTPG